MQYASIVYVPNRNDLPYQSEAPDGVLFLGAQIVLSAVNTLAREEGWRFKALELESLQGGTGMIMLERDGTTPPDFSIRTVWDKTA